MVRSTCPYCGVGCGVRVDDSAIAGDAEHPANFGRLCSKGAALGDIGGLDGRLLHPLVLGQRASWDDALDFIANRFTETLAEHGPGSVAFYVSGQLLTEDYYVANKLMKGFLGSAAIDTNSRLCMASSVAGHRRAFGEDLVPGCYEDFELADLIVLVGSNTAWCHPVLYQRMTSAAERRNARVVVIDPRRTATCADASLHLAIAPGTDVLLWNGLLVHLARIGAVDTKYIAAHTTGFEKALTAAKAEAPDVAAVASGCGVAAEDVRRFYEWFAATPRTVTAYSQGVNQSSHGTDKVNAILNCHLVTGRIGKPGASPFSLTGQPNAMGGREVGGLANQLAAHMMFDGAAVDRVRRFWRATRMAAAPGPKAVEMFDAAARGTVRALWIAATNPAVSLPDAERVRAALRTCPLVVVSDITATGDTAALAHVLLPAAGWGEKSGTVTNSERRISRQRTFRVAPGETRPDWWMFTQVARRMGFGAAFPYESPAQIFREHAALSAFENDGSRLFDIGALATLSDAEYDALAPVQWPARVGQTGDSSRILTDGIFPGGDGTGSFVALHTEAPAHLPNAARPLRLNTGRLRDQWHTMTLTGRAAKLARHAPEPCVDIHPVDAAAHGITEGSLVRLTSDWGSALARARVTEEQGAGAVFLPMHWSDAFTADCVVGRLANPALDAISGQPELKHTPVSLTPVTLACAGYLVARTALRPQGVFYWTRARVEGGYIYELGDIVDDAIAGWRAMLPPAADTLEYADARRGVLRVATLEDGALSACLFAGPPSLLPPRDWLLERFARTSAVDDGERGALLSGRAAVAQPAKGRIVCSCFAVGVNAIVDALRTGRAVDTRGLGAALGAGTNCGSCLPELRALAAATKAEVAA